MTNLRREVNIISINHPSILKFIGYSPVDEYSSNGSLGSIIQLERQSLSPESQTTLEDDYLFPKIADFGLSKVVHSNSESASLQSTVGFKGTPIYVDSEYTKEGDVYSFAIIVYELLTINQPFQDFSMMMMCKKVAIEGVRPEFTFKIDDCYRELIEKCWSQNPKDVQK